MDRRSYVGSSDISALLGISPWKTPYQLWLEKTATEALEDTDSAVMKRGRRVEPFICEVLQQDRGFWIVDRNKRVQHPEHPFLWAESDFTYVVDAALVTDKAYDKGTYYADPDKTHIQQWRETPPENIGHGEAKSVGYNREGWGPDGSQEVPAYYLAQVYFALACNGLSEATIAAAFSYDELRCYHFAAEPEIQAELVRQAVEFWDVNVTMKIPPAAKTLDDSKLMLERLDGFNWEASEEAIERAKAIADLKAMTKVNEKLIEQLEKDFIDRMLSAAAVHGVTDNKTKNFKALGPDGKAIATYNTITRKGYTVSETTYKQLRWSK